MSNLMLRGKIQYEYELVKIPVIYVFFNQKGRFMQENQFYRHK